jgi:hypothetical protein
MTMDDLHTAFDLIRDNPSLVDFAGAQPVGRVSRAEAALGLEFPPSYKRFVTELGCGGLGSAEFYGVVGDDFEDSCVPDAIWLTLEYRRDGAPPEFIIVGNTGDGGAYAIDTAQRDADGESPVVEWWPGFPETSDNRRVVASDFGAFFLEELTEAIARAKRRFED